MPMNMCQSPTYPEIYYRIQPHVMEAMDQVDLQGCMMPEPDSIQSMCDRISERMRELHPDMMQTQAIEFGSGGGLLNDLVYILFLNELFRRRRRYY